MKKILGILTICFVGLFMLASCSTKTDSAESSTNESTIVDPNLICTDSIITLEEDNAEYISVYFTESFAKEQNTHTGILVYTFPSSEELISNNPATIKQLYVEKMYMDETYYYLDIMYMPNVGLTVSAEDRETIRQLSQIGQLGTKIASKMEDTRLSIKVSKNVTYKIIKYNNG